MRSFISGLLALALASSACEAQPISGFPQVTSIDQNDLVLLSVPTGVAGHYVTRSVAVSLVTGLPLTGGTVVGDTTFNPSTVTASDVQGLLVNRSANYTGGLTGFVNSAERITDTAGANTRAFEWSLTSIMDNFSAASGGAQNVAIYGQGKKELGASPTWAATFELQDNNVSPATGAVTTEFDNEGVGADAQNNRIILDLWGKRLSGSDPVKVSRGIRINADANTTIGKAIDFSMPACLTAASSYYLFDENNRFSVDCYGNITTTGNILTGDGSISAGRASTDGPSTNRINWNIDGIAYADFQMGLTGTDTVNLLLQFSGGSNGSIFFNTNGIAPDNRGTESLGNSSLYWNQLFVNSIVLPSGAGNAGQCIVSGGGTGPDTWGGCSGGSGGNYQTAASTDCSSGGVAVPTGSGQGGVGVNVTSLTLAAGTWEVSGNFGWKSTGGTLAAESGAITTTSATMPSNVSSPGGAGTTGSYAAAGIPNGSLATGTTVEVLTGSTVVYLVESLAWSTSSGNSAKACGSLYAHQIA